MDEIQYSDEYIEALEEELREQKAGRDEILAELNAVYGSTTYRIGSLARTVMRDPVRAVKVANRVLKTTGRFSPRAVRSLRAATPRNLFTPNSEYKKWQAKFEPSSHQLDVQRKKSTTFKKKPKYSIITPVFQPPKDVLIDLLDSVLAQTYTNFELCLGEFSQDRITCEILKEYSKRDDRIKVKLFKDNDGISENSNKCFEMATGEYIALLDHDDLLSPDALYENTLLINEKDYDFIYSDKDKVDEEGNRFDPMFKPDWSPEIMLTANYLTHLNVFKKSLVEEIGGWDRTTDGAQDWDLFLRIIARSKHIGHIPKILYHWRVIATSTAHSISTKPYALEGQRKALLKHIETLGIQKPVIKHSKTGALSLLWGDSQLKNKIIHCIVLADEESLGKATKLQKKLAKIRHLNKDTISIFIQNEENNLGDLVNKYKKKVDVLLFMDARIKSMGRRRWLDELLGWLYVPGVGIVSPQTYNKYGVFFEAGRVLGAGSSSTPLFAGETYTPGMLGYREWSRNTLLPSMYCFAINTKCLDKVEVKQIGIQGIRELALKVINNGYRIVITPYDWATVDLTSIYEPSMSRNNKNLIRKIIPQLNDPYYSKNLSVETPYIGFNLQTEKERTATFVKMLNVPVEYDPTAKAKQEVDNARRSFPLVGYRRDAYILSKTIDYVPDDITRSQKITKNSASIPYVKTAIWMLPNFTTVYAGLKNIFALAIELSKQENTQHTFYVASYEDITLVRNLVAKSFPELSQSRIVNAEEYKEIRNESFTIGVCTLWTTAYDLLKNNNVERKIYIVQDNETRFYPSGSIQSLVQATYKFGFWAIAGTDALKEWYESSSGNAKAATLASKLDIDVYMKASRRKLITPREVPRIIFYARPEAPRNGFELGVNALNILAQRMNGKVDIVLAGADFDLTQYTSLHPSIRTAGKVAYKDLPKFYTSFDSALFLMFSEHPGVFGIEMMASSCPVVVNKHTNAMWKELYRDRETCIIANPSASSIAEALYESITNSELRRKIVANGRKIAQKYHQTDYSKQAEKIVGFIKEGF